jgi:predicted DCC family thiol-disulfide oxidoreductase YuxK
VPDLVLYDGACGFCHRSVAFLARRDRDGSRFRFAPLGGETAATRLSGTDALECYGTVVVLTEDGRLLSRGDAVLHALARLEGGWPSLARALRLLPRLLRDGAYSAGARVRGRLFDRPPEACPRLPANLAERFLP